MYKGKKDGLAYQVRNAGFKDLNELSEITGESIQSLRKWFKKRPTRFRLILFGAAYEKGVI